MYLYYGTERTSNATELNKYDIMLTTYSILSTEQTSWDSSPMGKIEWWRVILDEAHVIKNARAQQSKAVTRKEEMGCHWDKIQNGPFDLLSLMVFLHCEPFSIKCYWESLIQRQLTFNRKKALSCVQVIFLCVLHQIA